MKRAKSKRSVSIRHQGDVHGVQIKPPKLLVSPPKHSVKKLLSFVDRDGRDRAKNIAVKEIRTIRLPKAHNVLPQQTLGYRVDTYSKHNKHIHRVTIFCVEGTFAEDSKVIVDCSCSSHIFHYENPLAKRGNAFLWRSNGHPPMVYNKIGICKHTYTALRVMLRRQEAGVLVKRSRDTKRISFMQG